MKWKSTLVLSLFALKLVGQSLNLEVYDGEVDLRKAYKDVIFSFKNPKNTAPYLKTYEQLAKLDTLLVANSNFEHLQKAVSILEVIDKDPTFGKGANYDVFHKTLVEDVYKKEAQKRSGKKPDTAIAKTTTANSKNGVNDANAPALPAKPKGPEYELDPNLLLFVGIPLAFLLGAFLVWSRFNKKNKEREVAYQEFEAQKPDIERYRVRGEQLAAENEKQKMAIDELTNRNLVLETRITELKTMLLSGGAPEPTEQKQKREAFYMSAPARDQTFNNMNRSKTFQPTVSMYRFTIENPTEQPDIATVEFMTDETSVYNAVNYPDTYIFPICKIENGFNARAKIVRTVKMGKAKLFDGFKWRMLEPVVLRYE
jgi:cell division protein FtsB